VSHFQVQFKNSYCTHISDRQQCIADRVPAGYSWSRCSMAEPDQIICQAQGKLVSNTTRQRRVQGLRAGDRLSTKFYRRRRFETIQSRGEKALSTHMSYCVRGGTLVPMKYVSAKLRPWRRVWSFPHYMSQGPFPIHWRTKGESRFKLQSVTQLIAPIQWMLIFQK